MERAFYGYNISLALQNYMYIYTHQKVCVYGEN